jgi:hypothetical protein
MPVGRWGWDLVRVNYAAERGSGKFVIAGAAIVGAILYLATAVWFDVACWALTRFAGGLVGRRARTGISVAFAVVAWTSLSASVLMLAPALVHSPGDVAIGTAGPTTQSQTPDQTAALSLAWTTPSSEPIALASPPTATPTATPTAATTPVDGDDEAGPSVAPGTSFAPGPTGAPVPAGSGSASDRLPGEPDPTYTPGALNPAVTQATIKSTICVSGWTATIRPPSDYTTGLKIEQIAEYGYSDTSTADYEEDHLISLELGGSPTDPRNLWPEPYTASLPDGRPTGAHTKDGFETKLKYEVCAGTITLAQAQADIGDHWVHAYYGIALASSTSTTGTTATPGAAATRQATSAPTTPVTTFSVKITSLPGSINHGANATMVAVTSPSASCSASVTYFSGTVSSAQGLQTHPTADSSGSVSWTWKVGTSTKPGTSTATVTCQLGSDSASDSATFVVT